MEDRTRHLFLLTFLQTLPRLPDITPECRDLWCPRPRPCCGHSLLPCRAISTASVGLTLALCRLPHTHTLSPWVECSLLSSLLHDSPSMNVDFPCQQELLHPQAPARTGLLASSSQHWSKQMCSMISFREVGELSCVSVSLGHAKCSVPGD